MTLPILALFLFHTIMAGLSDILLIYTYKREVIRLWGMSTDIASNNEHHETHSEHAVHTGVHIDSRVRVRAGCSNNDSDNVVVRAE